MAGSTEKGRECNRDAGVSVHGSARRGLDVRWVKESTMSPVPAAADLDPDRGGIIDLRGGGTMVLRCRISTRYIMAIVFLIAVFLGPAILAVEVYEAKEYDVHTGIATKGATTLTTRGGIEPPFWPR
jgi:hypothetical protein